MKYDSQLAGVKSLLANVSSVLVATPPEASIDELGAGLALYLALDQSGKKASIATEGIIRVGHTHLFGVGQIQNKFPQTGAGDYVITLGGVVAPDGTVPALEKMDYFPQGADLNLVFKVLPGQKFEPTFVTPKQESGNFDLIFTIGATTLDTLGAIYTGNREAFSKAHIVNIDNRQGNANFGSTNIVDTAASSVSEIMASVIPSLTLPFDGDIATNILAGIFEATANLQTPNVTAETYEIVAATVRAGGRKPVSATATETVQPATPAAPFDMGTVTQQPPAFMQPPADTSHPAGSVESFTVPPVAPEQPAESSNMPSPEEPPTGEGTETKTPEADWLTPKIFKVS